MIAGLKRRLKWALKRRLNWSVTRGLSRRVNLRVSRAVNPKLSRAVNRRIRRRFTAGIAVGVPMRVPSQRAVLVRTLWDSRSPEQERKLPQLGTRFRISKRIRATRQSDREVVLARDFDFAGLLAVDVDVRTGRDRR